jgi:ABC-type oligopeptide transport system ATPase subunit
LQKLAGTACLRRWPQTKIVELRDRHGLAFPFISHSLALVETISDQVGLMHGSNFVETGSTAEVFRRPTHACTKRLIDAEPRIDPRKYDRTYLTELPA